MRLHPYFIRKWTQIIEQSLNKIPVWTFLARDFRFNQSCKKQLEVYKRYSYLSTRYLIWRGHGQNNTKATCVCVCVYAIAFFKKYYKTLFLHRQIGLKLYASSKIIYPNIVLATKNCTLVVRSLCQHCLEANWKSSFLQ